MEAITSSSEWHVVWDSDLLTVDTWSLIDRATNSDIHSFALLQHRDWGNEQIAALWAKWITTVLGVEALENHVGTFVPHHMWFR